MRVEGRVLEVAQHPRLTIQARASDQGLVERDPSLAQGRDEFLTASVCSPDAELARRRVELEHRAAVGISQLDRVRHDRGEHLVQLQAGADGMADIAQCLQLLHGGRQVP